MRTITARICTSTMRLPRWLLMRNISVGTPSTGETVTSREKTMRAVERENFANTRPVASAVSVRLVIDSATISTLAAVDSGYRTP